MIPTAAAHVNALFAAGNQLPAPDNPLTGSVGGESERMRRMMSGRPGAAMAAAWVAFMAGLLAGGEVEDLSSLLIAAASGALLVAAGFAAASRCRVLPQRANAQRARLALLAIASGALLGTANLGANWLIAEADPALRALLTERMRSLAPLQGVVAAPLVEEVIVRLFLMSVIAWLVFHFSKRATLAFAVAVSASALVFALLHLARPFPGDPALASFYRTTLLIKYMIAGVPLGVIFWRWGLPYSILCHAVANGVHLVLQRSVF
jgi:membrane protease YdiL (CAAX protease family)